MALALCLTLLPTAALAAEGHQHCVCGKTSHVDIGDHTVESQITFDKWLTSGYGSGSVLTLYYDEADKISGYPVSKDGDNWLLDGGNYYLRTDVDNYKYFSAVKINHTIVITGNVTICLNGQTLESIGGNMPVFRVKAGGTLTLTDCQGNPGKVKHTGDGSGSGVEVESGGTFNMYGGTITGNTADTYGGGVCVTGTNSKFNMYGGKITDNTATNGGGGVYVSVGATFTMDGNASVTSNRATGSNGTSGGVYVSNNGTFTMNGGTISGNTAISTDGGVGVYRGTDPAKFEMNGGEITGNQASQGGGVGVHRADSAFIMNGGTISGNTATNNGGGVYVKGGKFEMNGPKTSVSGNTATDNGGGVHMDGGTFTMKGGTIGGTTDGEANTADQGGGVYVSSGTFTMSGGSITGNDGNGVFVHDNAATTFTVSGAPTVMGNTRERAASNVFLAGSKTITIGGKLTGSPNSIGVTRGAGSVIAKGKDLTEKLTEADAQKFKSDKGFAVSVDTKNNQLVLTNSSAGTHRHNWNYQNDGDATIKATCTNSTGDCAYRTNPATVTISTDQTVYDCAQITEAPTAQLTYSDNWPAGPEGVAKADASKIAYYKSVDDGTSYAGPVTNKNELKKPGKYVALLYFNGKYLEAHFSVVDTSKQDPTYTPPTAKSGLVYTGENQPLIDHGSTNHGRMWYKLGTNDGYSTLVPMARDAGSYTVYYKVEGDATHNDVAERSIMVTIARAELSGTPTFTKVTEAGKTLEDVTLTKPKDWPEGTFEWGDGATETSQDTQIVQGQAYSWYYRSANHFATGKIVPWANPSSGSSSGTTGGGSSSGGSGSSDSNPVIKTETKNNPDGSTTKTETRKDGSVTQTITGKDGSTSKTETKKDGSSVTENKAADGSTGTVKTDKNGQIEAKTALSNKAIEAAKKNGEAVKAPLEVEASRNSNTAPTVKVELPQNSGKTEVEIPVSNANAGTVAVLVHPDGTEEILKDSIPTDDGIRLTVDGSATVKIVDNAKGFIDTQNHWAKDEIDFVSARELVNGISATRYAPDATATRAQLWTILARQNDADLSGGANWYEKAQLWSKDKGISDGTQPDATITRAQMVTMLWRTMGQPAATGKVGFADVPAGSYYAQAVAWAVEGGITQGVGGDRFDPNATCTRAQIAAFLARSMK